MFFSWMENVLHAPKAWVIFFNGKLSTETKGGRLERRRRRIMRNARRTCLFCSHRSVAPAL